MSEPHADLDARTVAARRVLLDALEALHAHRNALVLVGAQAVYLRSEQAPLAASAYTFDGDLGLDPRLLDDDPRLEQLMRAAGFELNAGRDPGIWLRRDPADSLDGVEVDLLVPASLVAGRRAAHLDPHDRLAARTAEGLELALHDNDLFPVPGLGGDRRRIEVRVAGTAALLVAKAHKLTDRLAADRAHRLKAKDAADCYRLMTVTNPYTARERFQALLDDPTTTEPTQAGLDRLHMLFATPNSIGADLAVTALTLAGPSEAEIRDGTALFISQLPHGT